MAASLHERIDASGTVINDGFKVTYRGNLR